MKKSFLQSLGPGLLFAGAAIGVSHLVQSTKAGAEFGFGLLWALFLVHLCKYPFFQFGPRFAAATGKTLLEGYKELGKGVLVAYYILNFATMFTIQAAVTVVTASLATQLFGDFNTESNLVIWSTILLFVCTLILLIGKYSLLDKLMKYVIIILSISTLTAVVIAFGNVKEAFNVTQIFPSGTVEITFLIAFLGWMPAPLDVSIWHSIWSVEKSKTETIKIKPKDAIFDFNVGYIGTLILGICFVLLGALVMYKSGEIFSNNGSIFASQLINLYTKNLGGSFYIIIAIAAFTTMFSTTIASIDASTRSMNLSSKLLFNKLFKFGYWFWILLIFFGTSFILCFFMADMGFLVKIATILSFLTAPFYAILNYLLVTGKQIPKEHQPSLFTKILSMVGIVFLIGFSVWFIFTFFKINIS